MGEKKSAAEIQVMRKPAVIKYIRDNRLDPAGRSAGALDAIYIGNLRRIAKGEGE